MIKKSFLVVVLLVGSSMANAGDLRDLCPDRPGKGTPACTLDKGHIEYEMGLLDWTRDRSGGKQTDTLLAADSLLRIGLTGDTEAQIAWSPYGQIRIRDHAGAITKRSGSGDVTLAIRHNLQNPDGHGLSIAVQPFVTLPVGQQDIGATSWNAGVIVPLSIDLSDQLQFALVPEIDAAADAERVGRHLAYALAASITAPITSGIDGSIELRGQRDDDPSGHETELSLDFAATWQPGHLANAQLDIGSNLGINRNTPDIELYTGIAWRF